MARWTDLATWRGPTPNQGAAMKEQCGLVVHIAEGTYEGTISWQRNDSSNVSSHFIVARDGRIAQIVDTDVTAWTQSAGNGHWLSVENEGFTPNPLTAEQVEANARLFARGHQVYGYPLQLAVNPDSRGLGHHSMGCNWPGGAWGHCDCPGDAIIAQKQAILSRAIQILNGEDMSLTDLVPLPAGQYPELNGQKTAVFGDLLGYMAARGVRQEAQMAQLMATVAAIATKVDLDPAELDALKAAAAQGAQAGVVGSAAALAQEIARELGAGGDLGLDETQVQAAAERAVRTVLGALDAA